MFSIVNQCNRIREKGQVHDQEKPVFLLIHHQSVTVGEKRVMEAKEADVPGAALPPPVVPLGGGSPLNLN